jgi:hypothetical protein
MWFLLEEGRFHKFLMISQLNGLLQKEKNYQNIHPQLIHITLQKSIVIKGI